MKFQYTFKDGVTLPMNIVTKYDDIGLQRQVALMLLVGHDPYPYDPEQVIPIPQHAAEQMSKLYEGMFHFLKDAVSTDFEVHHKAGVAIRFDIIKEEDDEDEAQSNR